jgi:hypothetical protein
MSRALGRNSPASSSLYKISQKSLFKIRKNTHRESPPVEPRCPFGNGFNNSLFPHQGYTQKSCMQHRSLPRALCAVTQHPMKKSYGTVPANEKKTIQRDMMCCGLEVCFVCQTCVVAHMIFVGFFSDVCSHPSTQATALLYTRGDVC